MTYVIHPVILCGGSGTRLWPLSTPQTPKQFLALTSSKSMIEETAERFQSTDRADLEFASLLVVGSKRHEQLLSETLTGAEMILEPMGRNSAPAVAAAAMARGPDDLILILPADHDIRDIPAFHDAIAIAAEAAEAGDIVTFGIEPTHPATGYGYIKAVASNAQDRALAVDAFVEKPDMDTAQSYLDAGSYYWNAGIFLFKASVMLDALEAFAPDVSAGTRSAMVEARDGKINLDSEAFAATPSISIDYAVMEKVTNVKTVPVSMGWSDVGGYRALHELLTENEADNYTTGPVHVQNSSGLYVRSEGPIITVNGVSDLVVVATNNEVMITPKENDAAVKDLGKVAQNQGQILGISPKLRDKVRDWLWTAFDVWSEKAWDLKHGGFVEQLDMAGNPDREAPRRIRVQARQVFSFAKAIEMGWPGHAKARKLVDMGLSHLDANLRHPKGGWVHTTGADGQPIEEKRDLYDHAFVILAAAKAYEVTRAEQALKIADDAISFIDNQLKDHEHHGWFESLPRSNPRRANPHMHLLEAMLAYHSATGCPNAIARAGQVVRLFEAKFYNPATDVMAEYFTNDWQAETPADATIFEPGHHYEWATLLLQYEALTGHDTLSWRRRLIRCADQIGINPTTGFAFNSCLASGNPKNANSRLWVQLERMRAYQFHKDIASSQRAQLFLKSIFSDYLDPGPKGLWVDELDSHGLPVSEVVPASMLYHTVTAFESML